jgi:hypothetical protein
MVVLALAAPIWARADDPPATPDPQQGIPFDSTAARAAKDSGETPVPIPLDPVNRANRMIMDHDPLGAIAVCKANLKSDSSDAPLRSMLNWAYIARDRVCLPLPPSAAEFVKAEDGHLKCVVNIVPTTCADTVQTVLADEVRVATDQTAAGLIAIDYLMRFGTPEQVRADLEKVGELDPERVQGHLLEQVAAIHRPPILAVVGDYLLASDMRTMSCPEFERLIRLLAEAGNVDGAEIAIGRIPQDDLCPKMMLDTSTRTLIAGERYETLWKQTKNIFANMDPIGYYRFALTASLAAAHFDTSLALKRLAHEKTNEEAYPESGRILLADITALLREQAAPGEKWAELADRDFMLDGRFSEVQTLLRTLALKRNPRLEAVGNALAVDLASRDLWLLAAFRYEDLAGGRNAGLEQRWNPHRISNLRLAAAYYLAAEDNASARAMVAGIQDPLPEDRLVAGVAALRSGDSDQARTDLEAVIGDRRAPPLMTQAAEELLAMATGSGIVHP